MAKQKERNELEHLRAVVKQQRSIIKNLKKEISRHTKRTHLYTDLEDKLSDLEQKEEETKFVDPKEYCPDCSAAIISVDLGIRKLVRCSSCDYRKAIK